MYISHIIKKIISDNFLFFNPCPVNFACSNDVGQCYNVEVIIHHNCFTFLNVINYWDSFRKTQKMLTVSFSANAIDFPFFFQLSFGRIAVASCLIHGQIAMQKFPFFRQSHLKSHSVRNHIMNFSIVALFRVLHEGHLHR